MEKEVLDVIEKNLPAQTAGVMKKYIEQAEKDKVSLETCKATICELQSKCDRMIANVRDMQANIIADGDREKRIALLEALEKRKEIEDRKIEAEKYKLKMEEVEKRADSIKDLVSLLFKNTEYKSSVFTNRNNSYTQAYDYDKGCSMDRKDGEFVNTTETRSAE